MRLSLRSLRPTLLLLIIGVLPLLWQAAPARAEIIRSFDVELRLRQDTTLDVTETIQMDFENAQRRGIYRIIPVVYSRKGGTYTLHLEVVSVTDANGNNWNYVKTRQGRDVNIKIGDANRIITGQHTYRIHYTVRRAVNFFGGAPEVYWNATGNEWPFAIESASARFYPPPQVALNKIRTAAYRGQLGSTEVAQQSVEKEAILFSTRDLAPGEGLTFVAGLPAGSVTPPSALQTLLWFLADWWPLFLFPLLAATFVGMRYTHSGRDVDGGQAVAVEWNPPKDLTPAEVGTLVDEHCDMADIVSTLIDLAARGYLVIEEIESEKFLFFSSKDYYFKRLHGKADESTLLPHEAQFLRGVFGSLDTTTLSALKNKFYTHLPGIRDAIYESLMEKNLFISNPEATRNAYKLTGIGLLVVGVGGSIFGAATGHIAYGLGIVLAAVIVLLSARAMPAKTATGSRALRECLGFQRFVRLAEKDRIAVLAKDDPTIFGRLLPYAMVLGVADQWADKFKDLISQPPDWYVGAGYGPGHHFSSRIFVNDLGHGMHTMGSTFASTPAPESTSGGGGSGFSDGGGFSGGGFGGGGGGSW